MLESSLTTTNPPMGPLKASGSKLIQLIRQLALSFLLVSTVFLTVTAMLLWSFADTVDQQKIKQSTEAASSQLNRVGKSLAAHSKDYGWWAPTIENILINKNEQWLEINYRSYLLESFDITEILVLGDRFDPVYAEQQGKEVPAVGYLGFGLNSLQPLINKAQNSPIDEPAPVFGFVTRGGELFWVAVCAITSDLAEDVLVPGSIRPSLLFIRRFADIKVEMEQELGLIDLTWVSDVNHKSGHSSIPITDLFGGVIGHVSWSLELPGRDMLAQSLKWASPTLLFALWVGWYIHRRFRATFSKVEAMTVAAALLKNSQQYFQSMANDAPVLIWETNDKAKIHYTNQRFTDLLDRTAEEDEALCLYDLIDERDREIMRAFFENSLVNNNSKGHEFRVPDSKGNIHWLFVVCARQGGSSEADPRFIFSANDVTDRKSIEEEAWYKANYDGLTQLPNRSLFQNRLVQGIKTSARQSTCCALMFIDLDNFKNVNDSLGHGAGDRVLQEAARRIRESIRDTDTAARLGGDEFVLLLMAEAGSPVFDLIANRVLKELAKPFALDHSEVYLSGSIGIAMYPEDGHSDEVLMMNADTAMYHAKRTGRNQVSYYAPVMNAKLKASMQIEVELRKAIAEQELYLVYQPIVDVVSQSMIGVEALVRWRKKNGTTVYPDEFISIAEQTGLIAPLGGYVLEHACKQLCEWREQGFDLSMSINVSPAQLRDDSFIILLASVLLKYQLDASKIQLELTEAIFIENTTDMTASMDEISALGVKLAIDDFGTGYSSLSYLQKLSVDVLKIDKSFMDLVIAEEDSAKLVKAMVAMAHSLNLQVVAEGIETHEQQLFLEREGCDKGQGYFYGRPMEPEELAQRHFNNIQQS